MQRNDLTADEVRSLFDFNPATGELQWRVRRQGVRSSRSRNSLNSHGYREVTIRGRSYLVHRIGWLHHFGKWPVSQLDHVNGVRTDNRIKNLREATPSQNQWNRRKPKNNTSGFKGVSLYKKGRRRWRAIIKVGEKSVYLGVYKTAQEAHAAYVAAARVYFGEFGRSD